MINAPSICRSFPIAALAPLLLAAAARASVLDDIGITELRSLNSTLTGSGISVAQVEATTYTGSSSSPYDPQYDANNFEVDPSEAGPYTYITYIGKQGTTPTNTYDSDDASAHATEVANNFFGDPNDVPTSVAPGAAPGVAAVDNYNANYFFDNVIATNSAMQAPLTPPSAPSAPVVSVVNQSFIFDGLDTNSENAINQLYDDYVSNNKVIIVTAAGNGGGIQVPGSAYNVITVGDSDGGSSVGPTYLGTSKPDLVAPGGATSFSTPYVSGTAAVLLQAAAAKFSGNNLTLAQDPRTIKALLLAGTSKPSGWRNYAGLTIPNTSTPVTTINTPLDPTYGAGELNAYASYQILASGRKAPSAVNTSATPSTGSSRGSSGWDLGNLTSSSTSSDYAHYVITLDGPSTLTAALTWNRPAGAISGSSITLTNVDDFDLALVNASTGATVDLSQSISYNPTTQTVGPDGNVEYLYTQNLAAGTYDLQVIKNAGSNTTAFYPYALAYDAMLLGDANLDGKVDASDLQIVLNNFGQSTSLWTNGNFSGGPTVDLADLSDVLKNMNISAATTLSVGAQPQIAAAPEPASLALLALSLPLLTRRKPRPC